MGNQDRSWRELSVLIAGCGSIGKRHARVLSRLGIKDLSVFDPQTSQVKQLTDQTPHAKPVISFESGLAAKPDCVWILTPPRLHVPLAIEAMNAGCHVFCEKPISDRLDGLDDLARLVNNSGRKFMVGLCFRFHEGLLRAKQWLDEGEIGRLIAVRAMVGEPFDEIRPDYQQVYTAKNFPWGALDLTHDIDLAIWVAGQDVKQVYSVIGTYGDIEVDTPDLAQLLIEFEDRCTASVHLDFLQRLRRRQFEMIGTKGVIQVEFAKWEHCVLSLWNNTTRQWRRETMVTDRDDMFQDENLQFLKAVVCDGQIQYGIEEACKSVRVVLDALQHS